MYESWYKRKPSLKNEFPYGVVAVCAATKAREKPMGLCLRGFLARVLAHQPGRDNNFIVKDKEGKYWIVNSIKMFPGVYKFSDLDYNHPYTEQPCQIDASSKGNVSR